VQSQWGKISTLRITSFRSINIFVANSHYSFYLKVTDDWQTQNKSVGCIPHLQSLKRDMWKLDELVTYDKVTNSKVDAQNLTYEKFMTHLGETYDFLKCGPGQKSDLLIRIGDLHFQQQGDSLSECISL